MRNKGPFLQESSNVYMKNKLLVFLVFIIACLNIWDSIQIGNIKDTHETILLPFGDVEPYRIRHDTANNAYVWDMSKYITYLYTTHNATTVEDQFSVLLSMFDSSTLPRYKAHLNNMAKDYAQFPNISHIGNVDRVNGVLMKDNRLTINYKQSRITGSQVKPPENKQLLIDYGISNGRFVITEMSESNYKPEEQ